MSLEHIVKGYANNTLSKVGLLDPEKERIAKARLAICEDCSIFDKSTRKCSREKGGCGCNMDAKVYCMECSCPAPEKKWNAV